MKASNCYLGIDWGGTYIKAGLVDSRGKIIKKIVVASQELRDKSLFLNKVKDLVDQFNLPTLRGLGVGAPGIIDKEKGLIFYLPNIPGWEQYPLRDVLRKTIHLPVYIANDANLFALAEARIGAAKDAKSAVFLTLGTGVGGAVMLEGRIQAEVRGAELGHISVSLQGQECGCGGQGCIETFVGSNYLLKRYRALKKDKTTVKEVKDIFYRARLKEREALMVWEEFSEALGRFLGGMVNVFGPEVIVLGGGVAGAFTIFKPLVFKEMQKQAMWPRMERVRLVKAKLHDAGIIGAALLAKESLEKEDSL